MIYSGNLTNRELLANAMPLSTLSRNQWGLLLSHIESIERTQGVDSDLFKVLETLHNNQARIEIIGGYLDSHCDEINAPVREESVSVMLPV
ncbi:MAG: hypothetical protein IKP60_13990 [Treponema sp.]|nr:hypothetical protein [Treponema sp.]